MVVVCRVMELAPVTLMGCDLGMTVEHFKLSRKILLVRRHFSPAKVVVLNRQPGSRSSCSKKANSTGFPKNERMTVAIFRQIKTQNDQYVVTY